MKKIISAIMAMILVALSLPIYASAATKVPLSKSAGIEALRGQFQSGVGPETNGYALDYEYYSPAGKLDSKKYPLVIFLHGIGHGDYVGSQLNDCPMTYWSSKEMQERWTDTHGAYILVPRSPENKLVYWSESLVEPLRALIDDFIEANPNVDTTRIFIGGSSAGGEMAWNIAIKYPEVFAGIFPMAAIGTRSASDIQKIKDIAVWVFASKLDPLVNFNLNVKPQWDKICEYSSCPKNCRISEFNIVKNPDGTNGDSNHRLYTTISYDFFTENGETYPDVITKDATGNTVTIDYPNGMISWMCGIHSSFDGKDSDADSDTNITDYLIAPIRSIIFKLLNIIQRFMGFV